MFIGKIVIMGSSTQGKKNFFEIFAQHVDEDFFSGPTIFISFSNYVVKKLLYDM